MSVSGVTVDHGAISNITAQKTYILSSDKAIDEACLRALRCPDSAGVKNALDNGEDALLRGAYSWIFADKQYRKWREEAELCLLWVKGEAGKGKTMMLIGLVNELEAEEASNEREVSRKKALSSITTYFLCRNADTGLNTAEAIIKGLIRRLVWRRPYLVRFVRQHWDAKDGKFDKNVHELQELWNMFLEMLSHCRSKNISVFILIDALDECQRGLSKLLQMIVRNGLNFKGGIIKWFLTSRPNPELEDHLRVRRNRVHVDLELNAKLVNKGIEYYIDNRMQELPSYDKATLSALKELIVKKANGTFLWVSFVCQELRRTSPENAMASVRALPIDLHQFYKEAYDRCCNDDTAFGTRYADMLNMLILANRPLRPSELAVLLDVPDKDAGAQGFSNRSSTFLKLSAGQQTEDEDDQFVEFVHESARDFLKSLVKTFDDGKRFTHEKMVERCLTILNSLISEPSHGILLETDKKRVIPLRYAYVAISWIDHIEKVSMPFLARISGIENGMLDRLLRDHFFEWLALVPPENFYPMMLHPLIFQLDKLAKIAKKCLKVTETVKRSLQYHKISQRLEWTVQFLIDADRSIECYCTRDGQPERLKMASYLLFNPESSTVRKSYIDRTPEFFTRIPKIELRWQQIQYAAFRRSEFLGFSRDGRLLVMSSWKTNTVCIFATDTGKAYTKMEGHDARVVVVAISPDGQLIATGSWDTTVKVWDMATGKFRLDFTEHVDPIAGVNFSPSGRNIVSASDDGAIKVWNVRTGVVERRLTIARFDVAGDTLSLAVSRDECLLAIAFLGTKRPSELASVPFDIRIFDLASRRWSGNKYIGKLVAPLLKASSLSTIQCHVLGPQLELSFNDHQLVVNRAIVASKDSDQSYARSVSTAEPYVELQRGCQSIRYTPKHLLPIPEVWKVDCYHYCDGHLILATNGGYVLKFEISAEAKSITSSPKSPDTQEVKGPQYSEVLGPLVEPHQPYLFGKRSAYEDPNSWQSEI